MLPGRAPEATTDAARAPRDVAGKRLVLATGVRDELPAIPRMPERWGVTVLHCPYYHGYEVAGRALGVVAAHPPYRRLLRRGTRKPTFP